MSAVCCGRRGASIIVFLLDVPRRAEPHHSVLGMMADDTSIRVDLASMKPRPKSQDCRFTQRHPGTCTVCKPAEISSQHHDHAMIH